MDASSSVAVCCACADRLAVFHRHRRTLSARCMIYDTYDNNKQYTSTRSLSAGLRNDRFLQGLGAVKTAVGVSLGVHAMHVGFITVLVLTCSNNSSIAASRLGQEECSKASLYDRRAITMDATKMLLIQPALLIISFFAVPAPMAWLCSTATAIPCRRYDT